MVEFDCLGTNAQQDSLQFYNELRKLNEVSKFNAYLILQVDRKVGTSPVYCYLFKEFCKVPLTKESREKTIFSTPEGQFQYKRMQFRLHSTLATFHRSIDNYIQIRIIPWCICKTLLSFSTELKSHLPRVQAVLDSSLKEGLTVNTEKYDIVIVETRYLGHIVGRGLMKLQ